MMMLMMIQEIYRCNNSAFSRKHDTEVGIVIFHKIYSVSKLRTYHDGPAFASYAKFEYKQVISLAKQLTNHSQWYKSLCLLSNRYDNRVPVYSITRV